MGGIKNEDGKAIVTRPDIYLTKDTAHDSVHGLAGVLKQAIERPVLEDVAARPAKLRVIKGGADPSAGDLGR